MTEKEANFSISQTTKGNASLRGLPFKIVKEKVLGKEYELSLVLTNSEQSKQLNRKYRHKDKPTNILSFPISQNQGEMFIDLEKAREEFSQFNMSYKEFLVYLFIHGVLHLKGLEHGSKMEKQEKEILSGLKIR